jgi:hypothetical protein
MMTTSLPDRLEELAGKATAMRQTRVDGDTAFVPLTRGFEALIDAADAPLISRWSWHVILSRKTQYAVLTLRDKGERIAFSMHRLLISAPRGVYVDHINGNGLDNRRSNLRLCSNVQNSYNAGLRKDNTSGFKGVAFHKTSGKWQAFIKVDGRRLCLGTFIDKDDARQAYQQASSNFHGEFGRVS